MTEYDKYDKYEYDRIWLTMNEYDYEWIGLKMTEYDWIWIWLNMTEYDWIWLKITEYEWIWLPPLTPIYLQTNLRVAHSTLPQGNLKIWIQT